MMRLLTTSQMREADNYTIQNLGMPSMVLMERASFCVYEEILKQAKATSEIGVIAGPGNNGGDAFAVARMLTYKGLNVYVYCPVEIDKMSHEEYSQFVIAKNYGVNLVDNILDLSECDILVDGLFGTGLSRDVASPYDRIIDYINMSEAYVVSIDIPSGLNGDSGYPMGKAVYADKTVAIGYIKVGETIGLSSEYVGEIVVADIGIPADFDGQLEEVPLFLIEDDILNYTYWDRETISNKSTCGKVLVIAGSDNMCGAAYLSGNAAFAAGAGMVRIYTRTANKVQLNTLLPEAIVDCYNELNQEKLDSLMNWASSIVIGPGLGTDLLAQSIVEYVLHKAVCPVVVDADAINIVAKNVNILDEREGVTVLTPHNAEAARLCDVTYDDMQKDALSIINDFARVHDVIVVYKSHFSIISDGYEALILNSGTPALATAGSGDVLSGIIGQLIGEFSDHFVMTAIGAYLHASAGCIMADVLGVRGMKASDIAKGLNVIFSEMNSEVE